MRQLIVCIGCCCLALCSWSCQDEVQEQHLIRQAASVWHTSPDSAFMLLDSIQFPEEMSPSLATEWAMLAAQVADSLGKPLPYPEQMQVAVQYYQSKKESKQQAKAVLFWARSLVENKSYEQAMQAYVDALEVALSVHDLNQAGYICSYRADLYQLDGDYASSIQSHEEANGYFLQTGNLRSYAFGLVNKAFVHMHRAENQRAVELLLEADSVAELVQDKVVFQDVYNGLGVAYERVGNYPKAEQYIRKSLQLANDLDSLVEYINLSAIYRLKGDRQTAWHYLQKADQPSSRPFHAASVCYNRYLLEKEEGDFQPALEDFERYVVVLDSVNEVENQMSLRAVSEKYKRTLLQSENRQLKINHQYLWLWILGLCLAIAMLLIVSQYRVRQKDLKIKRMNASICQLSLELQRRKEELKTHYQRLQHLDQLHASWQMEQEKYVQMQQTVERLNCDLIALRENRLLQSSVADRLRKLSRDVKRSVENSLLTDALWKQIEVLIVEVYPLLPIRLSAAGCTPSECRFCYLTLFKLDTAALAVLLHIIPDSVNKQRLRVRQKLHLVGKEQSLYDFLVHCQNQ